MRETTRSFKVLKLYSSTDLLPLLLARHLTTLNDAGSRWRHRSWWHKPHIVVSEEQPPDCLSSILPSTSDEWGAAKVWLTPSSLRSTASWVVSTFARDNLKL